MVGDDEKARGVVGVVLDIGRQNIQPVKLRRRITRNRTGLRVFRRQARGLGITRDRNARQVRQIAIEPFVALRQRLRM